ncbi:SDR family oxidoreductase [Parachryseolinea silvisoli]|uniref:SDR family oxidoreductase n=1 Tax=Parachryseolinea silvisoli TaxID=2873601 RepID=UPI002265A9C6|nr:SDR family oxidoreductase [Parachryseolinea silvisoli]MCD9014285.1 SDR family oxidoreductase [Parachryseolinea silvisoli]
MIVSIVGCGWFGMHFASALVANGHRVKGSTTSESKLSVLAEQGIEPFLVHIRSEELSVTPSFFHCDVLVITIPPRASVTPAGEYQATIARIAVLAKQYNIPHVIFISSTAVFSDVNGHVQEDTTPAPESDSGKTLLSVEHMLQAETAFTTTIVRFGGLVGPGRDPGRFFAGKKDVANGRAPVNLIHQEDCTGLCLAILEAEAFGGIVHGCAPDHPSRQAFYRKASTRAGLEEPVFVDELTCWKIVEGAQSQARLAYRYRVGDWLAWLNRP